MDDGFEGQQGRAPSVRELLDELSRVDRALRRTPLLLTADGSTAINPQVAPLLHRQRQLVAQLRARRTSWARSEAPPVRAPSASWPPPWAR